MNDIFNIRRFGKYFTTDARSCVANYGLSMLLISLMGLIIYAGTIIMGLIINGQWDGPGLGFRIFTFIVCLFVLTFTMPVKCYGKITEKRYGTQWLMIPVSGLEKTLSMVLMNAIVIPAAVCLVYLGVDSILCVMDGTCGTSIAGSMKSVLDRFLEISVASGDSIFIETISDEASTTDSYEVTSTFRFKTYQLDQVFVIASDSTDFNIQIV